MTTDSKRFLQDAVHVDLNLLRASTCVQEGIEDMLVALWFTCVCLGQYLAAHRV